MVSFYLNNKVGFVHDILILFPSLRSYILWYLFRDFFSILPIIVTIDHSVFQAQSDAQIDTLTSEQASSLVAHLNLGSIYTILQGHEQGPLSSVPGMDALSVKEFTVSDSYGSSHDV